MTPRQLFIVIAAVLLVSAATVGVIVGGAGDPFDRVSGAVEWLYSIVLAVAGALLLGIFNFIWAGLVSLTLGWALGDTGVAAIRVLGNAIAAWLGVMLLIAVTWAWLGHGADWRTAPHRWLLGGIQSGLPFASPSLA